MKEVSFTKKGYFWILGVSVIFVTFGLLLDYVIEDEIISHKIVTTSLFMSGTVMGACFLLFLQKLYPTFGQSLVSVKSSWGNIFDPEKQIGVNHNFYCSRCCLVVNGGIFLHKITVKSSLWFRYFLTFWCMWSVWFSWIWHNFIGNFVYLLICDDNFYPKKTMKTFVCTKCGEKNYAKIMPKWCTNCLQPFD